MASTLRRRLLALLLLALPTAACQNLKLFSEDYMNQLGAEAYVEETGKHRVITGTPEAQMVERVGRRIAEASGKDYQWEFKLLDAPEVPNAFCLPGGKVAVYSGILPITQNEDGLAAVLGHEVAHATEQHGNSRMSQGTIANAVLGLAQAGLSLSEMDASTQELVVGALGMGAQIGVMLPYSRGHETEADEIGIRYAIRAGYDPWEAPKLWERMAQLGDAGPTFLSTHPNPLDRAENLRQKIPQFLAEERPQARQ